MRLALLFSLLLAGAAAAEEAKDTNVFAHWSVQDLQSVEKELLALKTDPANKRLGSFGNHTSSLSRRESDGKAEVHEKKNDYFVVQSGEATLVTGGTVIDDKPGENGEHTGTGIKGGKETLLKPGDVVHIPAGLPHQLKIKKGAAFTYFVIKVEIPGAKP